ncbi:MAG: carboxymethylenebutenolidase [Rhodospirillales bacterium]|nr:carboxymethylenebutenolidase [Rhodospirillales bacterium]
MMSFAELPAFQIASGYAGFAAISPGAGSTGLLILPEMFGVTAAMQDAARNFAAVGISTLVPNMFRRAAHSDVLTYEGRDRDIAQDRADNLNPTAVCEDIELAIEAFRAEVPALQRVAALGHCIGGSMAAKPAQLHYGLDDTHIPVSEVEAVKALCHSNPNVAVFEYQAGHSFCNPYRPMFDKAHAKTAHERTLSLVRGL